MWNKAKGQRGVSLIAAVFIIVILAFMGAMFVSLITTGSLTSVNDLQSTQAFSAAEGGLEYILGNRTFPNYSMRGIPLSLGPGTFITDTPARLTAQVNIGSNSAQVNSTAGFYPGPGRIVIDSEVLSYTNFSGTTFNLTPNATAQHANGNAVYPVTRETAALANNCTTTDIQVDYVNNFLIPGVITIGSETFYCTGTAAGPNRFIGCTRCYKGSSSSTHAIGDSVFQYIVTSTGTVGNANRAVRESVGRTGGEAVTNGKFPNGSSGSWPDASCPPNRQEGIVGIDMGTSSTADGTGSLKIATQDGRKKTMNDCVGQTLATPVLPSTAVTLSLQYKFSSTHTCSNITTATYATCLVSIIFVYSSGLAQTVWTNETNASYPTVWAATGNIPLITNAGGNLTAIRISYDIESANDNNNVPRTATGWIDDVSLIIPGGAAVLSWQEAVN